MISDKELILVTFNKIAPIKLLLLPTIRQPIIFDNAPSDNPGACLECTFCCLIGGIWGNFWRTDRTDEFDWAMKDKRFENNRNWPSPEDNGTMISQKAGILV